jgi:hypothetical protein
MAMLHPTRPVIDLPALWQGAESAARVYDALTIFIFWDR